MKTITNKKGNKSEVRDILRLKNYFNELELGKQDKELEVFFNHNFNLFNSKVKRGVKAGVTPSRLVRFTSTEDNSTFELEFVPDMYDPDSITVRLINLNGNLDQVYTIEFDKFNDLTTIKYMKFFVSIDHHSGNISSNKLIIDSTYDNTLLRAQTVEQYHIGKGVYDNSTMSKKQSTFFSRYNDDYVTHTNTIGETSSNGESYEYFDGKKTVAISKEQFDLCVEKYESDLPKIKFIDLL